MHHLELTPESYNFISTLISLIAIKSNCAYSLISGAFFTDISEKHKEVQGINISVK